MEADCPRIIEVFNALFMAGEGTVLVAGSGEPIYLPRQGAEPYHQVVFANGFAASALHEVAHWCVAGPARRLQVDFGYWYKPDGRTAAEQQQFELVEVKPQAMEWTFAVAAGRSFHFSADNLSGTICPQSWRAFQERVAQQAQSYAANGLPRRARQFSAALAEAFATGDHWRFPASYTLR